MEVEHLGLERAPIWDAGAQGGRLAFSATVQALLGILKSACTGYPSDSLIKPRWLGTPAAPGSVGLGTGLSDQPPSEAFAERSVRLRHWRV